MQIQSSLRRRSRQALAASCFLMLAALVSGCSSGLQVRTDVDPAVDFSQYQTWNFFDILGIEGGYNSPIYGEHFRAAITREMNQRGYRMADDPDLYVNVTFRADDRVEMRAYSRPYMSGAYYARPGGAQYGSALGVGVGVGSRAKQITEASVFIDLVDNEKDRMSWQGVAVFEADDKVAQNLRDSVYTVVDAVFKQYPHTAGR